VQSVREFIAKRPAIVRRQVEEHFALRDRVAADVGLSHQSNEAREMKSALIPL